MYALKQGCSPKREMGDACMSDIWFNTIAVQNIEHVEKVWNSGPQRSHPLQHSSKVLERGRYFWRCPYDVH